MTRPTPAGVALALCGALAGLAAWRWGWPELWVVAFASLAALVVSRVACLVVAPVRAVREGSVARATAGDDVPVRLRLTAGRRSVRRQPALDHLGDDAVEVTLPPVRSGSEAVVEYRVPTRRRGHLALGPVVIDEGDPLGLFRSVAEVAPATTLVVHPRHHPLVLDPSGRRRDPDGPQSDLAEGSITFHTLRDYVLGDDLRRVHWRSSARTGALVVRHDVDPSEPRTLLVVDVAASAWSDDVQLDAGLEVAASVVRAAGREGRPLQMLDESGAVVDAGADGVAVLDALARFQLLDGDADGAVPVGPAEGAGLVVVVTGDGRRADDLVDRLRAGAERCVAAALVPGEPAGVRAVGRAGLVVTAGDAASAVSDTAEDVRARQAATDRTVATVAAAAAVAVAGASFASAFTVGATALLVGIGTVAGLVVGVQAGPGRRSALVRLAIAIGLSVVAVAGAVRSAVPADVLAGLVDGPRRLLSVGLPADGDAPARAVPALVVALATAAGVLAVRSRRPAVVPAVTLVVLAAGTATGLAGDRPRTVLAAAAALALLLAVAAAGLVRAPARPGRVVAVRRRRPLGAALTAVVAVVVGGLAAGPLVDSPSSDRATLRSTIDEAPREADLANPLDGVALALGRAEDEVYGSVRLDRPTVARLPLATFDAYDGDTFLFGTEVGAPGSGPGSEAPPVTVDLDLDTWPFASLPHPGPALEVDAPPSVAPDVGVDRETGRVVVLGPATGEWTITSAIADRVARPDRALDTTRPAPAFPPLPEDELRTIVDAAAVDLNRLGATEGFVTDLASRFREAYVAAAPGAPPDDQRGGHGTLVLTCIVRSGFTERPDSCADRAGTRTQLAAAFTLVLRSLGLPARLAVGWELVPTTLAQPLRSHALTAWVEVPVGTDDWLVVDPVPDETGDGGELGTSTPPPEETGPPDDDDDRDDDRATSTAGRAREQAPLAAVGVGAALLGAAILPAVLRRLRVRRRRRGTPAERLLGAWWEMRDQVRERGVPLPVGAHVTEVVRLHGIDDPAVPRGVNLVAFGGGDVDDVQADRAWAALSASDAAWRGASTRRQRLARYVCLGPILGRLGRHSLPPRRAATPRPRVAGGG